MSDKPITRSHKKDISVGSKQKDWMKKLEALSGQPLELGGQCGTVYLVVDCSGSMRGDKLVQAKSGAIGYAREAQTKGYSVGLIKFDSDARHLLDPQRELTSFYSNAD